MQPFRLLRVVSVSAAVVIAAVSARAFTAADFLRAAGPEIRAGHGTAAVVTLRGTNLGGWFVEEPWMCPTGFGAVRRSGWQASVGGRDAAALLDGDAATAVDLGAGTAGAVRIRFDRSVTFDRIALVVAREAVAAAHWELRTSLDGTRWRTVGVTSVASRGAELVLTLAGGCTARAVQLAVRGAVAPVRIDEVNLYQADDYTVRRNLAERFGAAQADALIEKYESAWITADDLDELQRWGMNVVRVPLNWLDFLDADGNWKSRAWQRIDWLLDACDHRGIYVILDLHAVPGGASPWASSGHEGDDGTGHNPHGFWDDRRCQDLTVKLWTAMAQRYRGRPVIAGYDLINEPLYAFDERPASGEKYSAAVLAKAAIYDRLYRAVRAVDPDHIIVIAAFTVAPPGATGPDAERSPFEGITPPEFHGWTNVVYETHHYDMAHPNDHAAQAHLVAASLRDLVAHQQAWKVPVYAGEYSLYGFDDVWAKWMGGLNAHAISWTNWTYKVRAGAHDPGGGNWGFFHDNPTPAPDIVHGSAAEIAAAWQRGATDHFARNRPLIELVRRFTGGARE